MIQRIGQLINHVSLDHITGLHIKTGLGGLGQIKVSCRSVQTELTAIS